MLALPVRNVLAYCKLSGIEYTLHDVNPLFGEHLSEEYEKISPNQEIPTIVHNGYNLWESGAIVSYLADSYQIDNQWYPKDLKLRGRVNSFLHWHHHCRRPIADYIVAKVVGPKFSGAPPLTEEAEVAYIENVNQLYGTLTWMLGETHYIARTPQPTIADIFAYVDISSGRALLATTGLEFFPLLENWYEEIEAIPQIEELNNACKDIMSTVFN